MKTIDITELLEDYVRLLEKGGIPRGSTESKLMLEAAAEIKELRSQLEFQIKLADDNNNSRLRLLDVIGNCRDLYEETCKQIREEHVDDSVCGMCIEDCDHGFDGYENECSGFEEDDCFRLNINKFNDIVFKKKGAQE
jgi:hypothetical protein